MARIQRTTSPIDGSTYAERPLLSGRELGALVERARAAQRRHRGEPLDTRVAWLRGFVRECEARRPQMAEELTWQMGRPIRQTPGEISGLVERATYMTDIAASALADIAVAPKPGFTRFIRRVPVGVVLVLAPWNYPYLTAINAIAPALLAGNAVVLKHAAQTPLCAERLAEAFAAAGVPDGLFQVAHADHREVGELIAAGGVDYVSFTGSVAGGDAVQKAAAVRRIGLGLELGGKDPAYVRSDADLEAAVENLVDGAFFNSGQSCCAIERIYVDRGRYEPFVEAFAETVRRYRLGNPLEPEVNLGPVVRTAAADFVRAQIDEAVSAGARPLVDPGAFEADRPGSPYLAPQVLVDVSHQMRVMSEESFGPVVGIMPVAGDDEAVALMNDSRYGLTASIWTRDASVAEALGDRLETGTVFMNRCDYLDPALAWTGVKDSGRGCSLSRLGYESLTRPKSFHLRTG